MKITMIGKWQQPNNHSFFLFALSIQPLISSFVRRQLEKKLKPQERERQSLKEEKAKEKLQPSISVLHSNSRCFSPDRPKEEKSTLCQFSYTKTFSLLVVHFKVDTLFQSLLLSLFSFCFRSHPSNNHCHSSLN